MDVRTQQCFLSSDPRMSGQLRRRRDRQEACGGQKEGARFCSLTPEDQLLHPVFTLLCGAHLGLSSSRHGVSGHIARCQHHLLEGWRARGDGWEEPALWVRKAGLQPRLSPTVPPDGVRIEPLRSEYSQMQNAPTETTACL